MRQGLSTLAASLVFFGGVRAARPCNTTTYDWRVLDVRYEGADPAKASGLAIIGVSIMPQPRGSFFECVGQWPESWNGWYEGGKDIIWSECINTGAAGITDRSVAMGLDWKNKTMYLTHSFQCSDKQGTDAVAIGSIKLNVNCTSAGAGTQSHCVLANNDNRPSQSVLNVTTTQAPGRLADTAACADNAKQYQSWQVERWTRSYELAAGAWAGPGSIAPPAGDSGPTFTLRSLGNHDVFDCKPSGKENGTFVGSCTSGANATTTAATSASFKFDPRLDMLTVTQRWSCNWTEGTRTFEVVGAGYIQGYCDRSGDKMLCYNDLPSWLGTKTL